MPERPGTHNPPPPKDLPMPSGSFPQGTSPKGWVKKLWMGIAIAFLATGVFFAGFFGAKALFDKEKPMGASEGGLMRLAFLQQGDVWIAEHDGSRIVEEKRITWMGGCRSPAWSADGRRVIFVSSGDSILEASEQGNTRYLLTANEWRDFLSERITNTISFEKHDLADLAVSRDDRYLFFAVRREKDDGGGLLARKDLQTGTIETLPVPGHRFAISPNGDLLVTAWEKVDEVEGRRSALFLYRTPYQDTGRRIGGDDLSLGAFSHDGDRIAAFQENSSTFYIFDLEGNVMKTYDLGALRPMDRPSFTPDGENLVFTAPDENGRFGLYSVLLKDGDANKLREDVTSASWSPVIYTETLARSWREAEKGEGQRFIAYERGGDIYLYDLDADVESKLVADGTAIDPYISQDQSKVIYVSFKDGLVFKETQGSSSPPLRKGQIYEAEVASGKVRKLVDMPEANCYSPCYSPDGRHIAFARETFSKDEGEGLYVFDVQLCLMDKETGRWEVLTESTNGWEWRGFENLSFTGDGKQLYYIDQGEGIVEAKTISLIDKEKRKNPKSLDEEKGIPYTYAIAFSRDGQFLAAEHGRFSPQGERVLIMDLKSGKSSAPAGLQEFARKPQNVTSFSPDGRFLLFGLSVHTEVEAKNVREEDIYVVSVDGKEKRKIAVGRNPTF